MSNGISEASQVIIAIIPIVGIVMGCVIIFFYGLWIHREKMFMIQNGTYTPVTLDIDVFSLLAGILLVGIGFVITLVILFVADSGYALLGGLIPLSIGIGLLIFYKLHHRSL